MNPEESTGTFAENLHIVQARDRTDLEIEQALAMGRLERENAQQAGLLEDGTKGMAALNGEIRKLRETERDLRQQLAEAKRETGR